jgi:hypothetical protein
MIGEESNRKIRRRRLDDKRHSYENYNLSVWIDYEKDPAQKSP